MEKQSSFSLKIGPAATEFVNSLAKNEDIEEKFVHVSDEVWLACRQIQIVSRFKLTYQATVSCRHFLLILTP